MGKQAKKKAARREHNELWARLKAEGVVARMEAVNEVLERPEFEVIINRRLLGAEPQVTDLEKVRAIALACLEQEFEVDTRDVLLMLDWQPDAGRQLTFLKPAPSFEAVKRVNEQIEQEKKARRAA